MNYWETELFILLDDHADCMNGDRSRPQWGNLLIWILGGSLALVLSYLIFTISAKHFGDDLIAAMTAFGVVVSSIISILLVAIYVRQTRIFERHGSIMEAQTNLMELEYVPDVVILGEPDITDNDVEVTVENRGPGSAVVIELVTRIEFQDSEYYESPLTGASDLVRSDGEHAGEQFLEAGETGTFGGEARLAVSTLSETERSRGFSSIVENLQSDVDRIRVSLFIRVQGHSGGSQEESILPEEAFYTDLEGLSELTLHECRRRSTPA